ncbi:MAG: hypothetical protein HY303_03425 [Candidatus Wallbacteria bacterium]|nr:hypothetical protein [Candidatus Wallbacteria bacterium]
MTDLMKKLNDVLERDKEAEQELSTAGEQAKPSPDDQIRKVKKAEEQVIYLSDLFHGFVSDNIMLEYPNLFTVARLGYRQAAHKPEIFGTLRTSAEHRVIEVDFKANFLLFVRFSALILSREFEVVAYFCRRGQEAAVSEYPLQLAAFREGPTMDWKKAFETIFVKFLEWYEQTKK